VPKILRDISVELTKNAKASKKHTKYEKGKKKHKEKNLNSINNITCSDLFRQRIITQPFLNTIFGFLDICENSQKNVDEFKITMFQIFEAIASD